MPLRFALFPCLIFAISMAGCHDQSKTAEVPPRENVVLQTHVPPECYRFDARLADAKVVAAPPRDDSMSRFRFSFSDATPWTVIEGKAHCESSGGVLGIKTETAATCESPGTIGVSPTGIGAILMQARVSGCSKFTFAWCGEYADFLEKNQASIDAAKSEDWALYQINTAKFWGWNSDLGNLGKVRFILPENSSFEVRSMNFVRAIDQFAGKSYGTIDYQRSGRTFVHALFARTPCSIEYELTVMPDAHLTTGLIALVVPTQFRVLLMESTEQHVLIEKHVDAKDVIQEVSADLLPWAGKKVQIRFEAESQPLGSVAQWCRPMLQRVRPVTDTTRPVNVIWYVIDCLRATNVSCYGYERETTPTLDSIAGEGVRFEWAFSPGTWTQDSVSSFFTGLSPTAHGMSRTRLSIPESMHTVSEELRTAGYATAVFSTNPYLEKRLGFLRGFDEAKRFRVRGLANRKNATAANYPMNMAVCNYLEKNAENPFFIYIHTMEVHGPYIPPASLRVFARPDGSVVQADLYDDCVLWADLNLRHITDKLKELGLWNNTLLIVSADHGQSVREFDGVEGHGEEASLCRVHIPLVMRLPGIIPKGIVVRENVQGLDIPRTLFELLQINPDPQFGGSSLLGLLDGSAKAEFAQRIIFPTGQLPKWQAAVEGTWYFHDNAGQLELYDLAADSMAKKNVSTEYPDVTDRLLAECRKYQEAERERAKAYPIESESLETSEELTEELRALGYLE